nr:hypothetical protein [Sphingomonas piscis]
MIGASNGQRRTLEQCGAHPGKGDWYYEVATELLTSAPDYLRFSLARLGQLKHKSIAG